MALYIFSLFGSLTSQGKHVASFRDEVARAQWDRGATTAVHREPDPTPTSNWGQTGLSHLHLITATGLDEHLPSTQEEAEHFLTSHSRRQEGHRHNQTFITPGLWITCERIGTSTEILSHPLSVPETSRQLKCIRWNFCKVCILKEQQVDLVWSYTQSAEFNRLLSENVSSSSVVWSKHRHTERVFSEDSHLIFLKTLPPTAQLSYIRICRPDQPHHGPVCKRLCSKEATPQAAKK